MSMRFDEKGKFFTDVITKEAIPSIIQTYHNRIRGSFHIRPGKRIKDEINKEEQFIAITDAEIYDLEENLVFSTDFMVMNRDHVLWIIPEMNLKEVHSTPESA